MPRSFTRSVCSWRALLVPPLMQLVLSPNASGLYSTRFPGRNKLLHRCYSLCNLRTPRVFTRPGFPGRHELSRRCHSLCSLRKPLGLLLHPGSLAGTNCPADATACAVSERIGPLLVPGSLVDMNCCADATACEVSNVSGVYSTRVPWQTRTVTPMPELV